MSRYMNNELRVFISSTFVDLQEEREHLVKKIFPEMIRPSAGVARSFVIGA